MNCVLLAPESSGPSFCFRITRPRHIHQYTIKMGVGADVAPEWYNTKDEDASGRSVRFRKGLGISVFSVFSVFDGELEGRSPS